MRRVNKVFKMIIWSISLLLILFIIATTINNRMGNCTVEGFVPGLGTTVIMVTGGTNSYNAKFIKLVFVRNGRFSFKVKLAEPGGGRILSRGMYIPLSGGGSRWMRSKVIDFALNPGDHIRIVGTMHPLSVNYSVMGNSVAMFNSFFRSQHIDLLEEESRTAIRLDSLEKKHAKEPEILKTRLQFDSIREQYNAYRLAFALQNPRLEVSAHILQLQEKDTIIKYYRRLSPQVLATPQGRLLLNRVKAWQTVETGNDAPSITYTTLDKRAFRLSDNKGKYIVLDFWGSWCGPCIASFPKLKSYYERARAKVIFVGISCRDTEAAWKAAIRKSELPWIHILNNPSVDDLAAKYGVDSYPTQVIINKEGKIAGIFHGEEAFYKQLDQISQ